MVNTPSPGIDEYLISFTQLRDVLLDPSAQARLSPATLGGVLDHRLPALQSPWQPCGPSAESSRQALQASNVQIPRTSVSVEVDEHARNVALKLAQRVGIDEVSALCLVKSARDTHADLDSMTIWYADEALAIPQVVLALDRLSRRDIDPWSTVAEQVRAKIIPDDGKFIEGLFRAWAMLAQKALGGAKRSDDPLSRHQLRLQSNLLELLFHLLYSNPDRSASTTEGLIRGIVSSAFGTSQVNREIWESDAESQTLQSRIMDLTLLIALESLCLSHIARTGTADEDDDISHQIVLSSREAILGITLFLLDQSEDLIPLDPEPSLGEIIPPIWPMPIICLAWSIVLKYVRTDLQPPSHGYPGPMYQEFAKRALRLPSGLFPWFEKILTGPLLTSTEDVGSEKNDSEILYRKVFKDVLICLAELITLEYVADQPGLHRAWELLYGGGSSRACLLLADDFWTVDAGFINRAAIIDRSCFPHHFTRSPRLLAALSGAGGYEPISQADTNTSPALAVCKYFTSLSGVSIALDHTTAHFTGKDQVGRTTVESTRDILLPGSVLIPTGTSGYVTSADDASVRYVTWQFDFPAWGLLIQILRTAAGFRRVDQRDTIPSSSTKCISLSVGELGIQDDTASILDTGFTLLRAVLQPVFGLGGHLLGQGDDGIPVASLLELVFSVMERLRGLELNPVEMLTVKSGLDILRSLLVVPIPETWTALRKSSFFGALDKRRSIAAQLIHNDAATGKHGVTISVLRLVASIVDATSNTIRPDDGVVKAALHLAFVSIWSPSPGWRYVDAVKRYDITTLLCTIFNWNLSHPLNTDGSAPSVPAQYLIDTFIHSASTMTYRPIVDMIIQAGPMVNKLFASHRRRDARSVVDSLETSLALLATLSRVSTALDIGSNVLPKSLFASSVISANEDRMQVVDSLFDLATTPVFPCTTRILTIKLIRTYLESVSGDAQRPSLAALLRNANTSCGALAVLAAEDESPDVRAATWMLLASIISTQLGCASACLGQNSTNDCLPDILTKAVDQAVAWDTIIRISPQTLASILNYCQAVLSSPSSGECTDLLRNHADFWPSVFEIAARAVPAPPTFTLSMHSEEFASRIQAYAYAVQAKASATSLLAVELGLILERDDVGETIAQSLVLGMFRNSSVLGEAAISAVHNSCSPQLHGDENKVLERQGVSLRGLKTVALPVEQEYGRTFLYDGNPVILGDHVAQAQVNLALDMLNLSWSMLDADIALTKAFKSICEAASAWTEGDTLAANASLRACVGIAEILANEDRGGDVMLTIQAERYGIFCVLLETALNRDVDVDLTLLGELCASIRKILESHLFPPMIGLRYAELPALHKPLLRVLFLVLQALPSTSTTLSIEPVIEAITTFTLEAADVVLDALIRQPEPSFSLSADLGSIVGVLCEVTRTPNTLTWLDKVTEHNLIARSLEVVVRARITNGRVAPHVASVLLLHLALASNPLSAERLAVSGILPSYSNNAIAVEAEQGRITSISPVPIPTTVHGVWCGMLLVVNALLSCLPDTHMSSFARSDVVPFLRVCTGQLLRTLAWNGETPISQPTMDELEFSTDVFYGVARAIGPNVGLSGDFFPPALSLLKSVRFALCHPRLLSTLFVPSSKDERTALENELAGLDQKKDPQLLDFKLMPTLARRTMTLMSVTRTVILSLITLTRAWDVVTSEEVQDGEILEPEEEAQTATDDPMGILNDLCLTTTTALDRLPLSSTEPNVIFARGILSQLSESTALLSTAQLILRHSAHPHDPPMNEEEMELDGNTSVGGGGVGSVGPSGGGGGGKRRISLAKLGPADREGHVLRELESDLRGLLPDYERGERGVMVWLRGVVDRIIMGE